jgi:hypothetical protein
MLKWVGLIVGAIVARVAWIELRYSRPARYRLRTFLETRGISVVRIQVGRRYGWPAYDVVFDSLDESLAFRQSPVFDELLGEVQSMHRGLTHGDQRFDAHAAITLRGK